MNKYMRHRRLPSCSTLMTALLAAVLVVNTFLFGVSRAQAETLEELQAKVEQTNSDYDAANQRVAELQKQIADNEARIAEIEQQLPEQRLKAARVLLAAMYSHAAGALWELLICFYRQITLMI